MYLLENERCEHPRFLIEMILFFQRIENISNFVLGNHKLYLSLIRYLSDIKLRKTLVITCFS